MVGNVQTQTTAGNNRRTRRLEAKRARKQGTGNVVLRVQKAQDLRKAGRLEEAERLWRQLLQEFPDQPQPYVGLALLLEQQDRDLDAYELYKKAVEFAPGEPTVWRQFGLCLMKQRQYEAATIALQKSVAIDPENTETLMDLGMALYHCENSDAALMVFDKVLELNPDHAGGYLHKGIQMQTLGDFVAAKVCLRKTLDLDPNMAVAYFRLASMDQSVEESNWMLERLYAIAGSSSFSIENRASALFSAAVVLQKQNKHDDAFVQFANANALMRTEFPFDRDRLTRRVDETIEAFSPETFEALKAAGSRDARPVFIIGMPRSGTTLVETIISSHPNLCAGGEETKIAMLADTLTQSRDSKLVYPRDIASVDPAGLAPIGELYTSHMARLYPDAPRTTDKYPFNFLHLGLIAVLFPNASIVHCRRDPTDTCLSCFFQMFGEYKGLSFTNDLTDLGFYYREYERFMAHWRRVLPMPIYEVRYEDLVASQEEISRQLIAHIGEDWDDACLKFHEQERTVNTASQYQVRQPIYKSSVEKWRKYERHLKPLQDALKQAL